MKKNYVVLHTGYPVAGRAIQPDEWKEYSRHTTESAAWKAVERATAHLDRNSWDDHYRVIDPDGNDCRRDMFYDAKWMEKAIREYKRRQK